MCSGSASHERIDLVSMSLCRKLKHHFALHICHFLAAEVLVQTDGACARQKKWQRLEIYPNPLIFFGTVELPTQPNMFTFREIFAGKARLSQVLSSSSRFMVGNPVEIINPNKHVGKSQDMLDDACFKQLLADTKKPNQIWHFGLPCGSFSILQHSNGGTRRVTCPEGDGSLPREVLGNKLLERTLIFIDSLEKHGNFWT